MDSENLLAMEEAEAYYRETRTLVEIVQAAPDPNNPNANPRPEFHDILVPNENIGDSDPGEDFEDSDTESEEGEDSDGNYFDPADE